MNHASKSFQNDMPTFLKWNHSPLQLSLHLWQERPAISWPMMSQVILRHNLTWRNLRPWFKWLDHRKFVLSWIWESHGLGLVTSFVRYFSWFMSLNFRSEEILAPFPKRWKVPAIFATFRWAWGCLSCLLALLICLLMNLDIFWWRLRFPRFVASIFHVRHKWYHFSHVNRKRLLAMEELCWDVQPGRYARLRSACNTCFIWCSLVQCNKH